MNNFVDLIQKKRRGFALSSAEIEAFVQGAARGSVPDYQLSALLMAICFQGMSPEETRDLTLHMAASGTQVSPALAHACVDKHSTGGVGDTTTLILTPLVAAAGGQVAKLSGRGLGFTGGTLDKLESIPGMHIDLTLDNFIAQMTRIGCAIAGQGPAMVPADKVLYALRDVTATVDCLPLIVSSIMSKKIASGCGTIILDVKTGSGAILSTLEEGLVLAEQMVDVGTRCGRRVQALVTGMDQPLGTHIGNALEVKEAIDILAGRVRGRLLDVSLRLGGMMLTASGVCSDEKTAENALENALASGRGLEKLRELIEAQGGDARVCDDVALLPQARLQVSVPAPMGGFVTAMDTDRLGLASQALGAGRITKDDVIDPAVGLVMAVELGQRIEADEPLATLYVNDETHMDTALKTVQSAIHIVPAPGKVPPLCYAVVRNGQTEMLL